MAQASTKAHRSFRTPSSIVWYSPWSSTTISAAPEAKRRAYTLPACGSPCTNPVQNSISAKVSDSFWDTSATSRPAARRASGSSHRTMSPTNSIVSTRGVVSSWTTAGTRT